MGLRGLTPNGEINSADTRLGSGGFERFGFENVYRSEDTATTSDSSELFGLAAAAPFLECDRKPEVLKLLGGRMDKECKATVEPAQWWSGAHDSKVTVVGTDLRGLQVWWAK